MPDLRRAVAAALLVLALAGCTRPGPGPDEPIAVAPPGTIAASTGALTGMGTSLPPRRP